MPPSPIRRDTELSRGHFPFFDDPYAFNYSEFSSAFNYVEANMLIGNLSAFFLLNSPRDYRILQLEAHSLPPSSHSCQMNCLYPQQSES